MKKIKKKIDKNKLLLAMLKLVVYFCENAAELGCPREKEVDMWIREMADSDSKAAVNVMRKLLKIIDRNSKMK